MLFNVHSRGNLYVPSSLTESTYNVLFVKARSTYRILPFSMAQDRRYVAANPPSHNHRHLTASTSQVIR